MLDDFIQPTPVLQFRLTALRLSIKIVECPGLAGSSGTNIGQSLLGGESIVRCECNRDGSGSDALPKMRVGPSKSADRSGLQITSGCVG